METAARLEPAFPGLNFITVPDVPDLDHRNGPIAMGQLPGDNSHWFVAERAGKIHRVVNDPSATELGTVLDITGHFDDTRLFQQWGIQSFAFHPDFENNGWLFVAYNHNDGNTDSIHLSYLSRFTSTNGGTSFDPATEEIILTVDQETDFHHLGHVAFGPDGYLYLSSGASPGSTGQDAFSLRGTLIRIDVDNGLPYTIPADNPFVSGGGLPEIYAWGLRNPWRFSFDSATGDLYLGDVGSNSYEEINVIENGGNYGWKVMEGGHCLNTGSCDTGGKELPRFAYSHDVGTAIIGGVVYRGSQIPELQGVYLFGDRVAGGLLWGLYFDEVGQPYMAPVVDFADRIAGFAEDQNGEVYVYNVAQQNNPQQAQVRRLVPDGTQPRRSGFPALLSETGCVDPGDVTQPAAGLIPYDVNAALWSDGADKRRWLAIPDGTTIDLDADGDFDFPIGTVLVKEFSFSGTPVETRLLMRHDDGLWGGYSYKWNEDLSDAALLPAGEASVVDGGVTWQYPSRAQCMQCHTQAAGFALGPEIAQLNRNFTYPESGITANQLETLEHIGMLTTPLPAATEDLHALAAVDDASFPVERRARGYLHANCAGCHRPGGPPQSTLNFRY
ncbi:MAG: PQQ-dependent sugar dehydrogenase, partial [Pseudomonadota bacterium]